MNKQLQDFDELPRSNMPQMPPQLQCKYKLRLSEMRQQFLLLCPEGVMNIEQIALEVCDKVFAKECSPIEYALAFLAAVDAERAKEGPVAEVMSVGPCSTAAELCELLPVSDDVVADECARIIRKLEIE